MNENNNNKGRGIFYGVIGVATLVVAIIGATFAYFTAAAQNGASDINGNMANIGFDLVVRKVVDPGATSGMIPMSNNMVEAAVTATEPCKDNNGNAVCQIYEITVTNNSSATMFVDGYTALAGGSGIATDVTAAGITPTNNNTTMRWAQVFATGEGTEATYSTGGEQMLSATSTDNGAKITINSLNVPNTTNTTSTDTTGFNQTNIKSTGVTGTGVAEIAGNNYDAVNTNFIRISDHAVADGAINAETEFTRTADQTSMLVINQQLGPTGGSANEIKYYFVVWLSETGTNQTARADATTLNVPASTDNFFNGIVRFVSAQGSEVTATFSGYTAVASDNNRTTQTTQTT